MANNQITPFQLTDQFTMDNFNQRINETNTALQNKAPAGFGLGGQSRGLTASDDINHIWQNGWYYWGGSAPQNAPSMSAGSSTYLMMRVTNWDNNDLIQEFWPLLDDFKSQAQRICRGAIWGPLEWVNPPLYEGQEYRTTERFRGKPVYTMAINTKAIGLGVVDDYPHGIANVDDIWVCGGSFIENGSNKYSIPFFGGASDHHVIASANRSVVHRINSSNVYVITDMIVILKYTKLTDD